MKFRLNVTNLLQVAALFIFGCASDEGSRTLTVKGTLVASQGSLAAKKGILDVSDYVYAVNTGYAGGKEERILAPISGGAFELTMSKSGSWVLVFIDSRQTGSAMIKGIFKAQNLDSIAPISSSAASESELGEVTLDPEQQLATLDQANFRDFIGDLGYTEANAEFFGDLDDLMLRHVNPDVDGNGLIDVNDEGMPEYRFLYSNFYKLGDSAFLQQNLSKVRSGEEISNDASIVYTTTLAGLAAYKNIDKNVAYFETKSQFRMTVKNASGEAYQTLLKPVRNDGGEFGYGIDGEMDQFKPIAGKLPAGSYIFDFYNASAQKEATFTFTNVNTRDDINDVNNFVFPFPVFQVDAEDTITAIAYHWKKRTAGGFVDATPEELELIMGNHPASIHWVTDNGSPSDSHVWVMVNPEDQKYAITGSVPASMIAGGTLNTRKRNDIVEVYMDFQTKVGIGISLWVAQQQSSRTGSPP